MSEEKTVSFTISSTTLLAISILVASLILSFSIMSTGNALGEKLSGLSLGTTAGGNAGTAVGNLNAGGPTTPPQTAAQYLSSAAQQTGATNTGSFSSCVSSQKYLNAINTDAQAGEKLFTDSGLKAKNQGGTPTFVIGKSGQKGYIIVGAVPFATIKTAIDKVTDGTIQDTDVDAVVSNISDFTGPFTLEGQDSAPVTMIEFSDFQCPFCGRFFTQSTASLRQQYISTGKVKFQYRHYPLPFHPNAMPAAHAFECAKEQGKALQMHDKLFQTQDSWSNLS